MITSLAIGKVELVLFRSEHFFPGGICFLLHGFAPIVGAVIVNVILAYLFVLLVCSAERELSREDDSPIQEPDKKHDWHNLHTIAPTFVTSFLSRTEHSPPGIPVFPI
jgi:hypothetical protein